MIAKEDLPRMNDCSAVRCDRPLGNSSSATIVTTGEEEEEEEKRQSGYERKRERETDQTEAPDK